MPLSSYVDVRQVVSGNRPEGVGRKLESKVLPKSLGQDLRANLRLKFLFSPFSLVRLLEARHPLFTLIHVLLARRRG